MIIAKNAHLGRTYDNRPIGVTVLTIARAVAADWTQAGVTNTAPGWWAVTGLSVPDSGGFLAWGLRGEPFLAEEEIQPAPPDITGVLLQRLSLVLEALTQRFAGMVPQPPAPIVDTAEFVAGVARLRSEVAALLQAGQASQGQRVAELEQGLAPIAEIAATLRLIQEQVSSLQVIEDVERQKRAMRAMRDRLNMALNETPNMIQVVTEVDDNLLAAALAPVRADMERLYGAMDVGRQAEERRLRSVQALDRFLVAVGGDDEPGTI